MRGHYPTIRATNTPAVTSMLNPLSDMNKTVSSTQKKLHLHLVFSLFMFFKYIEIFNSLVYWHFASFVQLRSCSS